MKGNETHIEDIQFWDFYNSFWQFTIDAHPIRIGYLVTELWAIYQCWKQYKTKEFELFLCQVLKNNIRLIPLDHVTYDKTKGSYLLELL